MPGFDGTGPMGVGPMTGGARGFCAGLVRPYAPSRGVYPFRGPMAFPWRGPYAVPAAGPYRRPRLGLGFRRGWGTRWLGCHPLSFEGPWSGGYAGSPAWDGWYEAPTAKSEKEFLKEEAEALKAELDEIQKRLKELDDPKKRTSDVPHPVTARIQARLRRRMRLERQGGEGAPMGVRRSQGPPFLAAAFSGWSTVMNGYGRSGGPGSASIEHGGIETPLPYWGGM